MPAWSVRLMAWLLPILTATVLTSGANAQCLGMTGLGSIASVPTRPFEAELYMSVALPWQMFPVPDERKLGTVARDGQGRVRTDVYYGTYSADPKVATKQVEVIDICDPVSLRSITMHPSNKTAIVRTLIPQSIRNASVAESLSGFCKANFQVIQAAPRDLNHDDLGKRLINGVSAGGIAVWETANAGILTEYWCSEDLQAMVKRATRYTDDESRLDVFELNNIKRVEPDRGLFVIPPDYQIVREFER
jgi:hypothetical protein